MEAEAKHIQCVSSDIRIRKKHTTDEKTALIQPRENKEKTSKKLWQTSVRKKEDNNQHNDGMNKIY